MTPGPASDGALLEISVTVNARRSAVADRVDGVWRIRLAARPIEGRANAELLRFLAEALDVPRTRITLVSGESSRRKRLRVPLEADAAATRLAARLEPT